jgi:drug/metabolite transporter (DMT)-like permease
LLLLGVGVLFVKNGNSKVVDTMGLILASSSAAFFGIGQIVDGVNSRNYSPALYAGLITLLTSVAIFMLLFVSGKKWSDFKKEMQQNVLIILGLAFTNTVGYFFMITSFDMIDKSIALPVINASVAITIILSYIFLHERDHIIRKTISVILVFTGIVLVSLA